MSSDRMSDRKVRVATPPPPVFGGVAKEAAAARWWLLTKDSEKERSMRAEREGVGEGVSRPRTGDRAGEAIEIWGGDREEAAAAERSGPAVVRINSCCC